MAKVPHSVFLGERVGGRRTIGYLLAEQASDQFHHAARGAAAFVEERIELHDVERTYDAGIVQQLHDEVRLAIGCAARHRGADTRRHFGIEKIDIKTQMQHTADGLHLFDDAADQHADADLVNLAHISSTDAAEFVVVLFKKNKRARAEQFEPA